MPSKPPSLKNKSIGAGGFEWILLIRFNSGAGGACDLVILTVDFQAVGVLGEIANLFENCAADFKKVKQKKSNQSRYAKDSIQKEKERK
ncbi:MAG: hypothetical protein LWY06_10140 [Firmicutes bacterium]|nr:hypothetical protein [Bacillota bacterium]